LNRSILSHLGFCKTSTQLAEAQTNIPEELGEDNRVSANNPEKTYAAVKIFSNT